MEMSSNYLPHSQFKLPNTIKLKTFRILRESRIQSGFPAVRFQNKSPDSLSRKHSNARNSVEASSTRNVSQVSNCIRMRPDWATRSQKLKAHKGYVSLKLRGLFMDVGSDCKSTTLKPRRSRDSPKTRTPKHQLNRATFYGNSSGQGIEEMYNIRPKLSINRCKSTECQAESTAKIPRRISLYRCSVYQPEVQDLRYTAPLDSELLSEGRDDDKSQLEGWDFDDENNLSSFNPNFY